SRLLQKCVSDLLSLWQVSRLLQKAEAERTQEDRALLQEHQDTVQELSRRQSRRALLKRKQEEVDINSASAALRNSSATLNHINSVIHSPFLFSSTSIQASSNQDTFT
uniref:Uncharacterized protein n=1 Tax=Sinocyclocheilus rhinocerous TaxID=307959 RepID=A0A673FYQ2_9TELE